MIKHVSVMPQKAIDLLKIKEDGVYVDGTLGRGGHSKLILERLKKGKLYCFDLDEEAIKESKEVLKEYDNVIYIHDNYMNMNKYVDQVDGILLDLGVSSPQFDEAVRGFSYRYDGPLDMRMDQSDELSAYEVVNEYDEERLAKVLYEYGEEKNAKRIARKIVEERPIETTLQLVEVIKKALPYKVLSKKGHPAKQSFQAIRIEVNHELDSLKHFLDSFDQILKVDGRVVIITFHSLEDKMVKYCFRRLSSVDDDKRIALRPEEVKQAPYELLNHGDKADKEEIENNSRAKSAIIRGVRKRYGKDSY
ncbi:MAG: 16S rRNA (cytosine(1402)-N(4))-methyltransferase RsmH [Erysipelotrichaceae bacterium]|jgi:16S rRNA (cytosine1402-N4)-methyltransferase|nr:16S rRNA (cytosine(1402)-N(4))-methyltransferase RsmH [Erysipelotrichaceae bacterium]